ncbi:MAG: hypothetical protein K2N34_02535 [Lachnospiraceae bacterium]|nr:hypothetical protein [Lachnospiraceae bacterium]
MPQKLSAMKYIKNNKRRVSVLVVSLSLCFLLMYLLYAVLSTTTESYKVILIDNPKKIQYIGLLSRSVYGISDDVEGEEYYTQAYQKTMKLAAELKQQPGIKEVLYSQIIFAQISSLVGAYTFEFPCVEAEEIPILLEHMGAELKEGRMPEHAGEVVLDEATMVNQNYKIGDNLYSNDFVIVGVLKCNNYFGCGVRVDKDGYNDNQALCVLSDGSIRDITALLNTMGYQAGEEDGAIWDLKHGEKSLKEDVLGLINSAIRIVYVGVLIVLSISLLVIYTMYLRDRYDEWCLYCSIGYSRKTIYFSILRELLFSFGAALAIGGVLIVISMIILDHALIIPLGMRCRYFYPDILIQILCSYVFIFGVLQIPIRYALYKIQTVDAIEDDLY